MTLLALLCRDVVLRASFNYWWDNGRSRSSSGVEYQLPAVHGVGACVEDNSNCVIVVHCSFVTCDVCDDAHCGPAAGGSRLGCLINKSA